MELFLSLLLLLLIFVVFLYFTGIFLSFTTRPPLKELRGGAGHGHRCYSEDLNPAEISVVNLLANELSHKDYFIFNNLILPSDVSGSTQIDHIVVSRFGIFVLETKECSGWIYANEKNKTWTITYQNGQKYPTYNPLRQNYGHIQTLQKLMPFVSEFIHGFVVYVGDCEFKTPRIKNVLYEWEVIDEIQKFKTPKISQQRLLMSIGKLSFLCQANDITTDQHAQNVAVVLSNNTRS